MTADERARAEAAVLLYEGLAADLRRYRVASPLPAVVTLLRALLDEVGRLERELAHLQSERTP